MKKADNIPDNNFNKFKRMFTIFGIGNIKKYAQLVVCRESISSN